ncbi:uncharacterized protein LOC112488027 [Cynoglossus semilaevis]|uniref:uncharacterized protein LOC112488027 n=1 Tax=Cynoglossus semilaevis TaxID=244447 RepID=UPI000D623A10|nr:uncharacterized protein LOC112488027 [Cynoglossus semilaevis]
MDTYLRLTVLLVVTATVTVEGSRLLGDTTTSDTQKPAFNFFGLWKGTSSDSKPSSTKDDFGFNLEDALHPAVKPTGKPNERECQGDVIQKLNKVVENQKDILSLLRQTQRAQ